jgi:hypothetical protein
LIISEDNNVMRVEEDDENWRGVMVNDDENNVDVVLRWIFRDDFADMILSAYVGDCGYCRKIRKRR